MSRKPKSPPDDTATNQTRQHYNRPDVRETILRFSQDGKAWRALNGDKGWYISVGNGKVRLRTPDDYKDTTSKYRTLYATLDILDSEVKKVSQKWNGEEAKPEEPIGTFKDCRGYTLGADIDSIGNIIEDPSTKKAVEDQAKFLIQKLNEAGISRSVHCLYSGGGIYVFIHHGLFRVEPEWSPEEREQVFKSLTATYNMYLADVEANFFELHPEHRGKVKIDKINNQKRKFKCIFSIHKKYDLAVVPLDPKNIKIDFERARPPLSNDVLREGKEWYADYDLTELDALKSILAPYAKPIEEDLRLREERNGNNEIRKKLEPTPIVDWPPCIKNVLEKAEPGKGPHRACSVLAAYLYQAGWSEEEALKIWMPVAGRCGVEQRIFEQWYGQMCCPNCSTIQETSAGYPNSGIGGLGYCKPDDGCNSCKWPGGYNRLSCQELKRIITENRDNLKDAKVLQALAFLKQKHQLDFTLLVKDLGIKGEVKKALDRELAEIVRKQDQEVIPPEINAKAVEILENSDPMQYIADSCGQMVLGAEKAFKKLTCCVSVQNILQSAGLHPKFNGESGGGKTWALLIFAHHQPAEGTVKGSMSAKAGYYHKDGDRLFRMLDDYQAGNEDLDTVIKQTSSSFHESYTHRTVANNKALKLEIGSEQTWAITSVDSSQDIQVLNRQIPINVDDSEELTRKVNQRTLERYGKGETQFSVDEKVLVCREIFRILRKEGYINVRIPFSNRIEWLDTSNRRNASIFMDILIGITAMNRFQREKDDEGYYLATEEDFHAAKELFIERDAEELVHRLTKRERQFAELLVKHKEGMIREEVANAMDLSPTRISHLANGEKGKGGLSQKLPGFCAREITDYEYTPGVDKRAVRKTLYKLEGYNPLDGFDAIVKLRECAPSADGVRVEVRNDFGAKIDNSEREKREIDRGSADSAESEREIFSGQVRCKKSSLSLAGQKKPHSNQETISRDTNNARTVKRTAAHSAHSEATDSGAHLSALSQECQDCSISQNPRKDEQNPISKTDNPVEDAKCPACGEDIGPGHSSGIFEGVNYCASCLPRLSLLRASVPELTKMNGIAPTIIEIYQDIAGRGRPPMKEFLPHLLRALGFIEMEGRWISSAENGDALVERANA